MKTAGIILIVFSLCGIAWLGLSPFLTSLPDAEPQPTREILATPTMRQAQPTATSQPTATATPWYDLPATQAAIDGMNAQANAAQAEKDLLQKQIELGLSNTSNQLTLAESDRQTIALVAKVTLVFTYAEATKQAHIDKTDLEKTDKSIEARKVGMLEIGLWGVLIVAILYAFIMLVRLWRSIDYRESGDSIEDDAEEEPAPVQPTKSFLPVSGNTMHSATVPTTDDAFGKWSLAMLGGATAGENQWTTAASPFTSTTYPPFLEWAERKGYVAGDPGLPKLLTDAGKTFCRNWLNQHGITPPPEGFIPIP